MYIASWSKWFPAVMTVVMSAATVSAQESQVTGDALNALPGIARVGVAGPVKKGITVSAFAGYGYSGEIVSDGDTHHRGIGGLAASFRFVDWLALSLQVDGRYDKHFHVFDGKGSDDGWVGNPRLFARGGVALENGIKLGGQLGVWFPGESAPSVVAKAITLDFTLMGTYVLPSGLSLSANAGFRLDQSAKSVDAPELLSDADRLSLGVSDSHAVLLGAGAAYRMGRLELLGEGTWDLLIGSDRPTVLESPLRFTAGARFDITRDITVQLLTEAGLSKRPDVGATAPLVPIEPRLGVFAGIIYRTPYARRTSKTIIEPPPVKPATLNITVKTVDGLVVAGAKIKIADTEVFVDGTGKYSYETKTAESLVITVSAENYHDKSQTVTVVLGEVSDIAFELEQLVPPGQLRGVVQSFGGKALPATIKVSKIDKEVQAHEDGTFEIDIPPGEYEVTIKAEGYAEQRRRVRIEREGVTLLNVDLRRGP